MSALTKNIFLLEEYQSREVRKPVDVCASKTIYNGGMCFTDTAGTGGATDVSTGTNPFCGIAIDGYANSGAVTTTKPLIVKSGFVTRVTLATGFTKLQVGLPVYCTTSNPADLTVTSTNAARVGIVFNYVSSTESDILWDTV